MAETGLLATIRSEMRTPGSRCGVALLDLTAEERAELEEALAAGIPASAVVRGLAKLGYKVADFTVNRHRRGDCTCGGK